MSSEEPFELDLPSLKVVVEELQRRIKEEENPAELEQYRKAFQKLVPFFMRSYFAGYLLRQLALKGGIRRKLNTTTLFLSIGKNRRVYPRDLVQLLFAAGQVSKTDPLKLSAARCRVISMRPNCEIGNTWVFDLSRFRRSRIRL